MKLINRITGEIVAEDSSITYDTSISCWCLSGIGAVYADPNKELLVNDLDEQKEIKKAYIRSKYEEDMLQPVVTPYGTFNGGEGSASSINAAVALAEFNNEISVLLIDVNNTERTCTKADALHVAACIGNTFRTLFYRKQALFRAIDAVTTRDALNDIAW